jgi:uronate dehydrogenase
MAESFTTSGPLAQIADVQRRVLVTGAAGRIGSYFAAHAHHKYDLRLMVQKVEDADAIRSYGEVVIGDLTDAERMKEICRGVDTVVHLAADASTRAPWESVLPNNIVGTYTTLLAAKASGCRRVIVASSIHAVGGYAPDVQVRGGDPVNPGNLYGVSKCFGEALGRYFAEQEGLSVIALRIGWFLPAEVVRSRTGPEVLGIWVSPRDLQQLIERCIAVENLRFAILHGVSNNRFKRLNISDARILVGYQPQDDIAVENPRLKDLQRG